MATTLAGGAWTTSGYPMATANGTTSIALMPPAGIRFPDLSSKRNPQALMKTYLKNLFIRLGGASFGLFLPCSEASIRSPPSPLSVLPNRPTASKLSPLPAWLERHRQPREPSNKSHFPFTINPPASGGTARVFKGHRFPFLPVSRESIGLQPRVSRSPHLAAASITDSRPRLRIRTPISARQTSPFRPILFRRLPPFLPWPTDKPYPTCLP